MSASDLFRAGRLDAAIESLGAELRDNPLDAQRRVFLFELLCFSGNLDRAEKQLDVLARNSPDAEAGALMYRSALHAERTRRDMFDNQTFPRSHPAPRPVSGVLNGKPFESLEDADPRIGARLEVYAAGQYTWLPLDQLASISMQAPKRLRDLLWSPAVVRSGPTFKALELGEVILPALTPLASRHSDDQVKLGRVTEWVEVDGVDTPVGQKLLLVDGEEFPILELRELEITPVAAATT
jgi:type VI secretion system protein ImpE